MFKFYDGASELDEQLAKEKANIKCSRLALKYNTFLYGDIEEKDRQLDVRFDGDARGSAASVIKSLC